MSCRRIPDGLSLPGVDSTTQPASDCAWLSAYGDSASPASLQTLKQPFVVDIIIDAYKIDLVTIRM